MSLAVEIWKENFEDKKTLLREIEGKLNYLISARPTAVNMKLSADELLDLAIKLSRDEFCSTEDMKKSFIDEIIKMLDKDIADNKNIGKFGAEIVLSNLLNETKTVEVLTHCNTGSLATAGYGTALGVVRRLKELNRLKQVYLTETRPYNQGARLTAFEMVHDKVPATLICKNELFNPRNSFFSRFLLRRLDGRLSVPEKAYSGGAGRGGPCCCER